MSAGEYTITVNKVSTVSVYVSGPGVMLESSNTDKDVYSGWGQYNGLPIKSEPIGPENKPFHICIKLASLGACIFKLKKVSKKKTVKKSKKG